jgi:hypothetical protein
MATEAENKQAYQKWWEALTERQKHFVRHQPGEAFDNYRELKQLSLKANRGWSQLLFLWDLLDCDFDKLVALELQIKNCFVDYCPGNVDGINEIMAMTPQRNYSFPENKKVEDEVDYSAADAYLNQEVTHIKK